MRDALKNYLALASGLTEVTKQQAKSAAKNLAKQGGASKGQVDKLASDLLRQSRNNRAMITSLVRNEVEKAVGRVGLASSDEVGKLTRRLQTVESAVRGGGAAARSAATSGASRIASSVGRGGTKRAASGTSRTTSSNGSTGAAASAPTKAAAKKTGAKKTAVKKTAVKKPAARKPAAKKPAKKSAKKTAKKATGQ